MKLNDLKRKEEVSDYYDKSILGDVELDWSNIQRAKFLKYPNNDKSRIELIEVGKTLRLAYTLTFIVEEMDDKLKQLFNTDGLIHGRVIYNTIEESDRYNVVLEDVKRQLDITCEIEIIEEDK